MNRTALHTIAGLSALLTILTFWLSTVIVELFFTAAAITAVKTAIAFYGLPLLVFLMALTGISGTLLAKDHPNALCNRKKMRMRLIAFNGVVIIPSALFLAFQAEAGHFGTWFYTVQAIELAIGLFQLSLIGRNIYDGRQLRIHRYCHSGTASERAAIR